MFQDRLCTPQYSDCARLSSEVTYTPSLAMSWVAPTKDISQNSGSITVM
jgi:hypothetical protein